MLIARCHPRSAWRGCVTSQPSDSQVGESTGMLITAGSLLLYGQPAAEGEDFEAGCTGQDLSTWPVAAGRITAYAQSCNNGLFEPR